MRIWYASKSSPPMKPSHYVLAFVLLLLFAAAYLGSPIR